MIVIGLPSTGMRSSWPEDLPHVVAHREAREHEGVAAIVAQALDAGDQAQIGARAVGLVERAHAVLERGDQVRQPVRASACRSVIWPSPSWLAEERPLGAQDRVLEDRGLGEAVLVGAAADQDVADLLEVQQPVGQLQIGGVEQLGAVGEGAGVLVVRVEQHDVAVGQFVEDRAQDHRDRAGLAGAGGAEHREVLAEQAVGEDEGRHLVVVPQPADVDVRDPRPRVDRGEVAQGHRGDRRVERRIARDAALEARRLGARRHGRDLAQHLDLEDRALGLRRRRRRRRA